MRAYFSLSAHADNGKIMRYYCLYLAYDLFGELVLTTYNGGSGKKGKYRHQLCKDVNKARLFLKNKLLKRLNAVKRIGCNYIIKDYKGDSEFEVSVLNGQLKDLLKDHI